MSQPTASDVHTDGSGSSRSSFKCVSCGHVMKNWLSGFHCESCKNGDDPRMAKATVTGSTKPAGGTKKKPASGGGRVQDEFPSCPSCGVATPGGELCDDCRTNRDREHKMGDLTYAQTEHDFQNSVADAEEEAERRDIRRRARARMAQMLGLDEDDIKKAALKLAESPPMVLKASGEARFSFAPMYMPGKLDAHGEFVKSADDLQRAAWEYVRKTADDRTVYLQHIDRPAGEWVEITSWPYAVEAPMHMPGGQVRKATLPAGTVYMGVIWEPWAWDMVKKGKLLGFSMGGWAKRVEAQLADESVTKHAGSSHDQDSHGNRGGSRGGNSRPATHRGGNKYGSDPLGKLMGLMDRVADHFDKGGRRPKDQAALDAAYKTLKEWTDDSLGQLTKDAGDDAVPFDVTKHGGSSHDQKAHGRRGSGTSSYLDRLGYPQARPKAGTRVTVRPGASVYGVVARAENAGTHDLGTLPDDGLDWDVLGSDDSSVKVGRAGFGVSYTGRIAHGDYVPKK